jgi:hypothetical protein
MRNLKCVLLILAIVVLQHRIYGQEVSLNEDQFLIKKGRAFSSLTFSLSQRKAENENQLLRQVIDQSRYNYRITGNGGYAIMDNMTLGLAFGYGRGKEEITFIDHDSQEITSKSLEQGFSFAPNMRNYIPLGKGQIQLLVQTGIRLTLGESLERRFFATDIDKLEGNFTEIEFGVSPGLILFFDRHWAFETTVGIAGFSSRIEENILNDDIANRERVVNSNIDLRLNLLQLNLGVAFYY